MPTDDSRFKTTPIVSLNGKIAPGRWDDFTSGVLVNTVAVPAHFAGRPDLIANAIYERSDLYWVLIAANSPKDTLNWPKAGDLIKAPVKSIVLGLL